MDHDELVELVRGAHQLQFDQVLYSAGQIAMNQLPPLRRLGLCHVLALEESRIRQEVAALATAVQRDVEKHEREQLRANSKVALAMGQEETGIHQQISASVPFVNAGAFSSGQKDEHTTLQPWEQQLRDNAWKVAAFVDVVLDFDIQPPFRDTDGFIDDSIRWLITSARYNISAARAARCMARNEEITRRTYSRYNPHDIAVVMSTLPYISRGKFQAEVTLRLARNPDPIPVSKASVGPTRVEQSQVSLESWIPSVSAEEATIRASWAQGCWSKTDALAASG